MREEGDTSCKRGSYLQCSNCSSSSQRASKGDQVAFTERHLQVLWFEQLYFHPLKTAKGEPILVLSPGYWNTDAGPDFKKAQIKVGETWLRGDVELHLYDEGWNHHHHQHDSRYDEVILHVAFWPSAEEKRLCTTAGRPLHMTYLEPHLTLTIDKIVKAIDLDLYPYQVHVGAGRCADALFHHLAEDRIAEFFTDAALYRLKRKFQFLQMRDLLPEQVVEMGIAMALGYKNNTLAFLKLYRHLLTFEQETAEELFVRALFLTGFFQEPFLSRWRELPHYGALLEKGELLQGREAGPSIPLHLFRIRPANHPLRRIFYLTQLLRDPQTACLHSRILDIWRQGSKGQNWKALREELCDLIPEYSDRFWSAHYTFSSSIPGPAMPLIGASLKREILINTTLPIIYQMVEEKGDSDEKALFVAFYRSLVGSPTGKSSYLGQRFFGNGKNAQLLSRSAIQQGAYQLHSDFCIHYEASCEGCPFVEIVTPHLRDQNLGSDLID